MGNAVGKPDQTFYDDSGTELGIGHSATEGASSTPPSRLSGGGGIAAALDPQMAEAERHQRERKSRRIREIMEESKKWGDLPGGCTLAQAEKQYQDEIGHPVVGKDVADHVANRQKFFERLMRPPVTPQGGGSKNGRNKEPKKGTWVCKECGVEFCDHRPVRSKGGRAPKDGQARRVRERVRLSDATLTQLYVLGLSSSDALALFAVAYREKRPLDDVIEAWKKSHGHTSREKILAAAS